MATKGTKVPSVYKVPSKADPELKLFAESIKEAVEVRLGRRGDPRDRAITLRELIDSGMAQALTDNPFDPNTGVGPTDFEGTTVTDYTIPPTPTGFTATATYTSFVLAWDNPQMGNFAYTEVWRSADSSIGNAIKVDTTSAFVWSEEVGYNKTYHYWVRHVSTSDIEGQYSASRSGTTSIDIGAVMTNLSETLADLPGYSTLTSLISSSAGTAATVIKSSSAPTQRDGGDALTTNDIWYDTDDGQVYTRNAANNAWVAARDATLVNLFGTTSFTGSTLSAAMASAQSDVVTLTSANTSRVSEITELEAITNGYSNSSTIAAAITSEATARATADTANATSITNLTSTVDNKTQTFVQNNAPTAIAVGDLWIDSNDNNKLYRASAVGASNWVAVRDTLNDNYPRVFSQTSAPTAINTGDLWFDTNDSNKQYRWDGSNWVAVRDVISQAAITSEASTRATNDTANATAITTLETSTNNALTGKASTASVTAVQNAVTNGTGSQAGYGVAVNANGAVAGMYLMADASNNLSNNTSTSNIIFEAGQVTIRNPHGNNIVPFTVLTSTDGAGNPAGVYINQAYIKAASITAAQIGSLSANLVNAVNINADSIDSGTLSATRIGTNTITVDKLQFGSGTVVTSSGSGSNAILTISNGGVIVDHIGANQLGRMASVDNINQSYTNYTSGTMSSFLSSSPFHYYTSTDKFGIPIGTTYIGGAAGGQISLDILGNTILETGAYIITVHMQTSGSTSSAARSGFAVNVTESTSSTSVNTDTTSSFSSWATGEMTGSFGAHFAGKTRQEQLTFTAGRSYRVTAYFYGRSIGNPPGGGTPTVSSFINVSRVNKSS